MRVSTLISLALATLATAALVPKDDISEFPGKPAYRLGTFLRISLSNLSVGL